MLKAILGILSFCLAAFGGIAVVASKSDIQIIVAVLCFGFAGLLLGQIGIIDAAESRRSG